MPPIIARNDRNTDKTISSIQADNMNTFTRRGLTLAALAGFGLLAACGNGINSNGSQKIDARVDQTLDFLYNNYPNTVDLADKSAGMLIMPVVTEAGFGFGAGYGRGALQINGVTVDYYSATSGSVGFQIGASQSAHVLFFMTEGALNEFRRSSGWAAGADVKYAVIDQGQNLAADTTTITAPVYAVIFGQAGLHVGATLEGVKYTRIIP
ncbi:hypothetical protein PH7735_01567 [Shimia thalassica]|uniref:Ysc84 actin-binding domain-containing protein n=2 Tax=Shimia thalassica TaxID=1715693 RepID=A0A0N7M905_9RHOB|nr:hypothetical protein PH7735_01567 [Shimia thalassica]